MKDFVEESLRQLDTQLKRIENSLRRLSDELIWKRLREGTNSIGNLCVHLAGNEYQHMVSGIGKEPLIRERSAEFLIEGGLNREELIAKLKSVREKTRTILQKLTVDDLQRKVTVYYRPEDWAAMRPSSTIPASDPSYTHSIQIHISRLTEHYAYHTGQIVYIAKLLQESNDHLLEWRH